MAKKRKTTKQQAWAVVDRETGEILSFDTSLTPPFSIYPGRAAAREDRRSLCDPNTAKVSRVTITIHH